MKIKFYGATEGVTGSNFLLNINKINILIDCGMFQGTKKEEEKNWDNFPYNPKDISYVVLTHSHIDHIGLLPKLVKNGFSGKIYSTPATKDFASIFLPDSKQILEKNSIKNNKSILYDDHDIEKTLNLFETIDYHIEKKIDKNISFSFYDAGHILGSAFIKFNINNKNIIFSGDLGNPPVPIIKDTEFVNNIDTVIIESTYGNREHSSGEKRIDDLENVIEYTYNKGGTLMIPSFAMERTQELLYELNELVSGSKIPKIPIYIDSPLAIKATEIYPKYIKDFDKETKEIISEGKKIFNFSGLKMVSSVEDSKKICASVKPKIIIAGSGMSTGGRIIYHEQSFLPDKKSTLLIIGYQVTGSLGRKIQDGEKIVYIHGKPVEINADVITLDSYSAHADQPKLVWWLRQMNHDKLKNIFLVHGEQKEKEALKIKIQDELGIETNIPKTNEEVNI